MNNKQIDVLVIGAGAAGIAASLQLAQAGLSVLMLEARSRIGGRMLTIHDKETGAAVELGAEFIHGRPPEIFDILHKHKIRSAEITGDFLRLEHGELQTSDFFSEVDRLMQNMTDRGPDESFSDFLDEYCPHKNQEKIKTWARGYVTGFHAADPNLISVHSLVKGMRAEEEIGGHETFRMEGGYATLLQIWEQQLRAGNVEVQLESVVKAVHWKKGGVEVEVAHGEKTSKYTAPKLLVTLPLSLLQAHSKTKAQTEGVVQFTPELSVKKPALDKLVMGKVIRVTLSFRERFWNDLHISDIGGKDSGKTLSDASFILSGEDWFPTWWTTIPEKLPVITGWAPFHCAERLADKSPDFVVEKATQTLANVLRVDAKEVRGLLTSAHYHNWETDPFSQGAYSYVKVGGDTAQKDLSVPIDETLFFAGEATDYTGHHGTVHAAIRSGHRAAKEILENS
ncbi:MAG TPA: NAD(P)/FAD-dependent oxidoreductase [Terriglobales bacterium]|jgi:monoamine oxidase